MNPFDSELNGEDPPQFFEHSPTTTAALIASITSFFLFTYLLMRMAERSCRIEYKSRATRTAAGFINLFLKAWHLKANNLKIYANKKTIIAAGPHRTGGLDGAIVISTVVGNPPRSWATDSFSALPIIGPNVIAPLLHAFHAISVKANAKKIGGKSANSDAKDKAEDVVNNEGCFLVFSQGNFAYLGKEPPRVYNGTAEIAINTNTPIHVVRLDGFTSFDYLPLFITNNVYFRSMLSMLVPNNVRVTLCSVIDWHLKEENMNIPFNEKVRLINAELYAYFRNTDQLSVKQIDDIRQSIKDKTHLTIWDKKLVVDQLKKTLKKETESLQELEGSSYSF